MSSALRADIRVSIQDRSAPDRVAGHLATGILVDGDAVLIPAPPDRLSDPDIRLEALIFPQEIDEHARIDALTCWKLSAFTIGRLLPVAMTARLEHHSSYAAQIGTVDSRRLARRLDDSGGNLWEALYELDAIPRGIHEIDDELLAVVSRIEREQQQPIQTHHRLDSYKDMTDGWCIFFCFCHPHKPD